MKNPLFTIAALSLSLLVLPSWAMDGDNFPSLLVEDEVDWFVSSLRDFHRASAEDDNDDSSSSSSSDSESDSGQTEDTKSKTFFIHIANPDAAHFYENLNDQHHFSLRDWKREKARQLPPDHFEDLTRGGPCNVHKLYIIMRNALKKFGATQTLMGMPKKKRNGVIVWLATTQEHSVKAVKSYCQKSLYVYKVFSNESDLKKYVRAYVKSNGNHSWVISKSQQNRKEQLAEIMGSHEDSSDSDEAAGVLVLPGSRIHQLTALLQEAQLNNNSPKNGDESDGPEDGGGDGSN